MHPSINLLLALVIVILTASATVLITRSLGVGRKAVQENRHPTLFAGAFDKLVVLLSVILVVMVIVLAFPGFVTSPNANLFIFSIVVCPAIVFLYTLLLLVLPRIKWVEDRFYGTNADTLLDQANALFDQDVKIKGGVLYKREDPDSLIETIGSE